MKNKYLVGQEYAVVLLPCNRSTGVRGCLIDREDLALVQSVPGTWNAHWDSRSRTHYARTAIIRSKTIQMHNLILSSPPRVMVDHVNHDGLDNRRSNIRLASHTLNSLNLIGANANNRSCGVRGVTKHKQTGKWQVQIAGKYRGLYADIETARGVANAAIADATAMALGVGL